MNYQFLLNGNYLEQGDFDYTLVEVLDKDTGRCGIAGLKESDEFFSIFKPEWKPISLRGYVQKAELSPFQIGGVKLVERYIRIIPENGAPIFYEENPDLIETKEECQN